MKQPEQPLPTITVLQSQKIPAVDRAALELLDSDPRAFKERYGYFEMIPMADALNRQFESDAHLVTYGLPRGDDLPRLAKSVLPDLRERDLEVFTTMLVLDYDNPGHAHWTAATLADFEKFVSSIATSGKPGAWLLDQYTAFYTTRAGARFVYVLEEPVPVEDGAARLQTLIRKFNALGVLVDEACKEWNRLFRLPRVRRDGELTDGSEFFRLDVRPENRLGLAHVPPATSTDAESPRKPIDAEKPDLDEAESLLWSSGAGGRRTRTEWWKLAKKCLRERECYPCIFDGDVLAEEGARNPTILKYSGQVVSLLFGRPGTSLQKCFALLLPAVLDLDGDDGGRAWEDTLWHLMKHAYEREAGKAEAEARVKQRFEDRQETERELIIRGAREWAPDLMKEQDDAALWTWIRRRMILAKAGSYWVLGKRGSYHPTPVRKDALQAHIRCLEMDNQLDYWSFPGDDKPPFERLVSKLLSEHLTTIDTLRGRANLPGGVLEIDSTGRTHLALPTFCLRTDIEPNYDKEVDEWLRMFLGRENYERGTNWIGMALSDFSRPICALSLVGPPSAGKKLLLQGLAECIDMRRYAQGHEMVSDFQNDIRYTPFVNVNEGTFKSPRVDAADAFRRWTSGDPIPVNAKFEVQMTIYSPLRVVVTANNDGVLRELTIGRQVSIEDRDAIGLRVLHLKQPDNAGKLLQGRGGLEWTEGWIDADDGSRGSDRVARHFLWLRAVAVQSGKPGRRLLVEGDLTAEFAENMVQSSGIAPDVIEAVVRMIEHREHPLPSGLSVDEEYGSVYVTVTGVQDAWSRYCERKRANRGRGMNQNAIAQVLRALKRPGWKEGKYRIVDCSTGKKRQAHWWLLDNLQLLSAAERSGLPYERLLRLIEIEQQSTKEAG